MTFLWLPQNILLGLEWENQESFIFVPSEPSKMLEQMMGTQ